MEKTEEPLPSSITIPAQIIEKWVEIPESNYLELRLTRSDIDKFYFAFSNLASAQAVFQDAMVLHSNQQFEEANKANRESRRLLIEGQNSFRIFFTALMRSVVAK